MNKPIRIQILTQYFPPETGAAATRMSDYALLLKEKGYDVSVICEQPAYFLHEEVQTLLADDWTGIKVYRCWVSKNARKTTSQRFVFYLSYMLTSFFQTLKSSDYDIMWVTSPPLTMALIGMISSFIHRKPYILDIRDLWPESVIKLGALKNPILIKILKIIEKAVYSRAVSLSLAVPGFKERIDSAVYEKQDFIDLPNGVSNLFIKKNSSPNPLESLFKDKFIVLFSGNMGIAQGLDSILRVAEKLLYMEEIHFVFVGDGVKKDELVQKVKKRGLNNVHFPGTFSKEKMPAIIEAADICLVHLKKLELFHNALPSKMFEYLAMERPIISNIPGEAKEFVEKNHCGIFVEPDNIDQFSNKILYLKQSPDLCRELGKRGRDTVLAGFTRSFFIERLAKKIQEKAAD